ncbi:MAG: hypothetical protein U0744_10385 [Gemmataceae bacterium]
MPQSNALPSATPSAVSPWPATLGPTMTEVAAELDSRRPQKAMELLRRSDLNSPWVANAMGVCQLRLGQTQAAVDTFRRLAVADHLTLRSDAPATFKANFAAALFLSGNAAGGTGALREISDKEHPAVKRLQQEVKRWQASLPLLQRINWFFGGEPSTVFAMENPGDLR